MDSTIVANISFQAGYKNIGVHLLIDKRWLEGIFSFLWHLIYPAHSILRASLENAFHFIYRRNYNSESTAGKCSMHKVVLTAVQIRLFEKQNKKPSA